MEKAFRVNIDFELQASQKTTRILKPAWQREWEYLFWWIESSGQLLNANDKKYNQEDLNYIAQKTGRDHFFSNNSEYLNWWGDPLNPNIIQKTGLLDIRKEIYNDHSSSFGEPISFPVVIKTNGSFSGKGVHFLKKVEDYQKIKNTLNNKDYIIEPYRDIKLDFSYYCFDMDTIYYRSYVKNGQYQGSLFSKDNSWLPQRDFVLKQSELLKDYIKGSNYGVDCYFYNKGDELLLEPLCEINNRRTIASCAYEIYQKYYSEYDYARNLLIPMKQIKNFKEYENKAVVRLSPIHGQYFYHVLILANDEKELVSITNQFQQFLNRS